MRRKEWFELHDHPLYPGFLRDLATEALEAVWNYTNSYRVIVPRLSRAMQDAGAVRILDLCSGGGGPWLRLLTEMTASGNPAVTVLLTDKYPNRHTAAERIKQDRIALMTSPVDAINIPPELDGFRTIFSTFHHFNPEAARAILSDAVRQQQGIAVFEAARRGVRTMFAAAAVPFLVWWVTRNIHPLRWSRLFWTYILPVVPLTLCVDGILSCLRAYSLDDLRELTAGFGNYRWEIGEEDGGKIRITYLIGTPVAKPAISREQPGNMPFAQMLQT